MPGLETETAATLPSTSVEEGAAKFAALLRSKGVQDANILPDAGEPDDPAEDTDLDDDEPEGDADLDDDQGDSDLDGDDPGSDDPDPDDEPDDTLDETGAGKQFRVKVRGETITVDEKERGAGYLRDKDYRQKTAKAAEQERTRQDEHLTSMKAYATATKELEDAVAGSLGDEPDWDTLREQDPAGYAAAHADHQRAKETLSKVRAERTRAQNEVEKAERGRIEQHRASEAEKLMTVFPDLQDPEKQKIFVKRITRAAAAVGFTSEDLSQVVDHRLVKLLDLAARGLAVDKARKTVGTKTGTPPTRTAKPGAAVRGTRDRTASADQVLEAQARKTGSVDDAAAALAARIRNSQKRATRR